MKKVDLDKEYDKWLKDNINHLQKKFNDIHNFQEVIDEAWEEYQRENGLIDKSNEDVEEVK